MHLRKLAVNLCNLRSPCLFVAKILQQLNASAHKLRQGFAFQHVVGE